MISSRNILGWVSSLYAHTKKRYPLSIHIFLLIGCLCFTPSFTKVSYAQQSEPEAISEPEHSTGSGDMKHRENNETIIYFPAVQLSAPAAEDPSVPGVGGWLSIVNYYRSLANLPPVTENTTWNMGAELHARYMVKHNLLTHGERTDSEWYTPEGQTAGLNGNVMGSFALNEEHRFFMDAWMQGPFHGLGMVDPLLESVGYGTYQEDTSTGLKMGAVLDVIRGRSGSSNNVEYPVMWPADGKSVPLQLHFGEAPSPLSSCPGYQAPSGLPIFLMLGSGNVTPNVTAHSFKADNVDVESCVFDESSYTNPIEAWQSTGRNILDARDAVVLVPRAPLVTGVTYTASITANGQTYTWSFESIDQ